MRHTKRYLAQITIEAQTPIAVGSGERNAISDRLVLRDMNQLPYIPGSALCGVLRHEFQDRHAAEATAMLFGDNDHAGSRLIVSAAHMLNAEGQVIEGIQSGSSDTFLDRFKQLPIRQHVRIGHRGVTEKGGKFDEELVYSGTRFVFELEMIASEPSKEWDEMLKLFKSPTFRIGGGTRKGFGKIKVVSCKEICLDLSIDAQLKQYLEKTSSLKDSFWQQIKTCSASSGAHKATVYHLDLRPKDFFLFSSGFSSPSGDADITPVNEERIVWSSGKAEFKDCTLIPASSIKGAIAHRVAYHYNLLNGVFADKISADELPNHIGENNEAVKTLFGCASSDKDGQRGSVILEDFFIEEANKKLFNHVAIDRFTGGAMSGALFSEEASYLPRCIEKSEQDSDYYPIQMDIVLEQSDDLKRNSKIVDALENTLSDLIEGNLALGGGSMRGHGIFSGKPIKNKKTEL